MQEVDHELEIERTLQIRDTIVDNDMEVEGQTVALQVFHGADHAPIEEATEVAAKAKESDGPPKVMDMDDSNGLLCKEQKQDLISVIDQLCMKLEEKSSLKIPLCRLRALLLVCSINEVDVQRIENEFVNGYRDGDRILYITLYNNHKDSFEVSDDIMTSWDDHWKAASNRFDARLSADSDLAHMVGKMFYVWESNHRLTAWWRHTNKFHADEVKWHMPV